MMNAVLYTLFLLGEFFCPGQTFKGERLKAVSRFQSLQQYYEMIKTQGRRRNLEIDADMKQTICQYIIANPFFDMNYVGYFSPSNKRHRKWLKKKYRKVFDAFFKRRSTDDSGAEPSCFGGMRRPDDGNKYTFVNPNEDRAVMVEGDLANDTEYYKESVFVCLAKHRLAETLKKYFVSAGDYNVNRAINANGINEYMAGRFVFTESEMTAMEKDGRPESKLLIVYALAEESGQVFKKGDKAIEQFYLGKKKENTTTSKAKDDDPVCTLTPDEKLRLCTITMSSAYMESQPYEFQPQTVFLEADCILRDVSFKTQRGLLQWADDGEYLFKEWTIGCQVKNDENEYEPFYVSRGYTANCAYIYKPVSGFVYLHHFQDNVSILRG